jgi:hypothetical protein
MTIAIYGDSFADIGPSYIAPGQTSWGKELLEKYDGKCYAQSGTSTWWNYENFLSTYKNHSIIIFSYSYSGRWPILPKELTGKNWYTSFKHVDPSDDLTTSKMSKYNILYNDIFNAPFFEFVEYNIFKSVNAICKNEGKYLINLMPLEFNVDYPNNWSINNNSYDTATDYPILHSLSCIACGEKIMRDGKTYRITDLHHNKEHLIEKRMCHLNNLNNILLAKTIEEVFENKKTKININLFKNIKWHEFDPMMQIVHGFV